MAIPRPLQGIKRLGYKIIKHPGSWIFLSLIAVGIAFAAPIAAPALIIFAGLATAIAAPSALFFQAKRWRAKGGQKGSDFIQRHPFQFAAIVLALALLVTALVLTIGFFTGGGALVVAGGVLAATGGGAFAFMGPLFVAIATPFATAAATWGISLFLPALAGFSLVIASLNFPNTLKRFLSWLDSFKFDGTMAAEKAKGAELDDGPGTRLITTTTNWAHKDVADAEVDKYMYGSRNEEGEDAGGHGYYPTVFDGISATIKNGFSSPYEEELEKGEKTFALGLEKL